MTLVLAAMTPETIWLLTDRRLTKGRRVVSDDAIKTLLLSATDGNAMLGYAGLGRTAAGVQPAEWMKGVLASRKMTIETALGTISAAMQRQMPRHITTLPQHAVIVPAFVNKEHRVYGIEFTRFGSSKNLYHRYTRFVAPLPAGVQRTHRFAVGGTGGLYLNDRIKSWARELDRILDANDRKAVSHHFVADHLAKINLDVHRELADGSVGHRCIVTWRLREGGGSHAAYTGSERDRRAPVIPSAYCDAGFDIGAVLNVMMPDMLKQLEAMKRGEAPPAPDVEEINRRLKDADDRISPKPKEELS